MSTYSFNKFGNANAKSNTLGSVNRQDVIQEANKKRTLLKDSSWIKRQPEEEEEKIKDENFGKSILNRYKSQENLDRDNDKEEKTTIHNRFKSDDALDRISLRNTSERGNKSATLERIPMSEPEPVNKSRQSWAPSNRTTTTTTEESKRKSWGPTNRSTTTTTTTETKPALPNKPDGQKITIYSSDTRTADKPTRTNFIDSARSRFEKTEDKPNLPTSPPARIDSRPPYPTKPVTSDSGERRSTVDRRQRSQDLDNLIEVSSSRVVNNKGNQNVDDLIDIKPSVEKGAKSGAQNIDNLIDIKPTANRGAKSGAQNIDNLIDIKPTANRGAKRDQLDDVIEISDAARSARKREDQLGDLIDIKKPEGNIRTQNIDNLIEIKNTNTTDTNKGNQDLDDLIAITGEANKGTNKYPGNSSNTTTRSSTTTTTYNVTSETSDAPNRRSTTTRTYNVSNDSQDYSSRRSTPTSTYKYSDDNRDAPSRRSTTTTYRDVTDGPSTRSNVTYTQDSGISSSNTYGQSIVSNSIKTVYSTSDRSVIEKDMCTYCRKPLGIDAKMILTDLNICCHATCFKCEACSGPLGNLKAGDSMWIYKQTIHCEPCYFSAREKWIL
ncbi:sciellin isoform X8 [Pyxicephalus adspersus]|uniref:sciellin isoform X8 n=1 Tax=Pyxicephalus adspersus TaxID=30357 RepID=UPI003B5B566B